MSGCLCRHIFILCTLVCGHKFWLLAKKPQNVHICWCLPPVFRAQGEWGDSAEVLNSDARPIAEQSLNCVLPTPAIWEFYLFSRYHLLRIENFSKWFFFKISPLNGQKHWCFAPSHILIKWINFLADRILLITTGSDVNFSSFFHRECKSGCFAEGLSKEHPQLTCFVMKIPNTPSKIPNAPSRWLIAHQLCI